MARVQRGNKEERVEARVTSEVKALLARAAAIQGRSVTDFIVQSTVEAAKRTLRDHDYLDMNERDRLAFVEAVLNPPPPSDRLLQAAARHQHMLED